MRVAIIGSSQVERKFDFEDLVTRFDEEVPPGALLHSGGAAYGDHIAVRLFLRRDDLSLVLHLPCDFSERLRNATALF